MLDYALSLMLKVICTLGLVALAAVGLLKAYTLLPDAAVAGVAIAAMVIVAILIVLPIRRSL